MNWTITQKFASWRKGSKAALKLNINKNKVCSKITTVHCSADFGAPRIQQLTAPFPNGIDKASASTEK